MPHSDPDARRAMKARCNREYRQRVADDPEYLLREKTRKAEWYAANKEKKAEAQRQYRARKRAEAAAATKKKAR